MSEFIKTSFGNITPNNTHLAFYEPILNALSCDEYLLLAKWIVKHHTSTDALVITDGEQKIYYDFLANKIFFSIKTYQHKGENHSLFYPLLCLLHEIRHFQQYNHLIYLPNEVVLKYYINEDGKGYYFTEKEVKSFYFTSRQTTLDMLYYYQPVEIDARDYADKKIVSYVSETLKTYGDNLLTREKSFLVRKYYNDFSGNMQYKEIINGNIYYIVFAYIKIIATSKLPMFAKLKQILHEFDNNPGYIIPQHMLEEAKKILE